MVSSQKVLELVKQEEVVTLLQDLVRTKSISGDERNFSVLIGKILEDLGLSVEFIEIEKDRPNVIGRLRGSEGKPVLLFHTHIDTVGPGKYEDWIVDPFSGEVRNGKIYGRGTNDAKGGLAGCIMAVKAIIDAKVKLKGDIVIIGTVGEENGDPCGMELVTKNYIMPYVKPDMAIYCHPEEHLAAYLYSKGSIFGEIQTFGKSAHGSTPHLGVNAISKMIKIIQAVENEGFNYTKHPVLGNCTIAFTTIKGGDHYNIIPDSCIANINIRLVPGQTCEGVNKELVQIIEKLKSEDSELDAKFRFFDTKEPYVTSQDQPLIKMIMDAGKEVGKQIGIGGAVGIGDIGFLLDFGVPGVRFGPGGAGGLHQANEFIEIDELVTITKIYISLILKACGY